MRHDLPDKYRNILNSGNGPVGEARSTREAILWNVVRTEDLIITIEESNRKNDKAQKWFLTLSIIGTALAFAQLVQVADILCRWFGKLNRQL
jgi:hypothetical protein